MANTRSVAMRERAKREATGMTGQTGMENLDGVVRLLDDFIRIPVLGVRIGLDPILGLIPWAGDTLTAAFSMFLLGNAIYYRVPKIIILRMALNVAFDYLIGLIPFLGNISDFFVRSNRWNLELMKRHGGQRQQPRLSDYLFVALVIGALLALFVGGIVLAWYLLRKGWQALTW